jgi:hypothetical protein
MPMELTVLADLLRQYLRLAGPLQIRAPSFGMGGWHRKDYSLAWDYLGRSNGRVGAASAALGTIDEVMVGDRSLQCIVGPWPTCPIHEVALRRRDRGWSQQGKVPVRG